MPPPIGRGQRALDPDQVLPEGRRRSRRAASCPSRRRPSAPASTSFQAIGVAVLGGGRIEDQLGGGPDVDPGAVALDEGDDGLVGDDQGAVVAHADEICHGRDATGPPPTASQFDLAPLARSMAPAAERPVTASAAQQLGEAGVLLGVRAEDLAHPVERPGRVDLGAPAEHLLDVEPVLGPVEDRPCRRSGARGRGSGCRPGRSGPGGRARPFRGAGPWWRRTRRGRSRPSRAAPGRRGRWRPDPRGSP